MNACRSLTFLVRSRDKDSTVTAPTEAVERQTLERDVLGSIPTSAAWMYGSSPARVTCGTSQVLLACVSGAFSWSTPIFAPFE